MTVEDVARRAGVHPSTVSRALNPAMRHRLTEEVVARVVAIAAELGYVPNGSAAALRTRRSKMIGVVLPDITNPVFPPILVGIEAALDEEQYVAVVANAGGTPEHARLVVERLLARQVDGLVLATASRSDGVIELCLSRHVPVVLVNRSDGGHRVSSVVSDDTLGMSLAVDHLTGLGHRRIGHLAGPQNVSTGRFRLDGFKAAMRAAGLETPDSAIAVATAYTRDTGREASRALLDQSPTLTAVVAANDLIALGLYDVLKERGMTCPDDLSVVGHNDMPFVDMISPPLTTVHIRHRQMGLHAARLLMNLVRDQSSGSADMVLKPELVVRESTGPV